jgi:hypothetical protein
MNRGQIFKQSNRTTKVSGELPYARRRSLLSAGELRFFLALHEAVGECWGISIKTRLADVIRCPENLWTSPHGRRLSQKHVDFVLYARESGRIVAAVELDDKTHERLERRERDAFLDEALRTGGVLLMRVKASSEYNPRSIRRYIQQATRRRRLA